jgi:hypothetical protein
MYIFLYLGGIGHCPFFTEIGLHTHMYFVLPHLEVQNVISYSNNWGSYMRFKEHQVHFHLEEYNTIWTCSNCSPVKCGKSDIVSFTSEVQIYRKRCTEP